MNMQTPQDALDIIASPTTDEFLKWRALASFLRELALSQGMDLDNTIEEE